MKHLISMRKGLFIVFAVQILSATPPSSSAADDYLTAPGDTLRVTVFQWPEYSGESVVDDSGSISIQAIGRVQAAGRTLAQIEESVADAARKLAGIETLKVVADVMAYRPISILGAVEAPNRYPYVVNTTVLDAVAMAGGFLRNPAGDLEQQLLLTRAKERVDTLKTQRLTAIARRARLLAEQQNLEEISFSQELRDFENTPSGRLAIDQERRLFALRKSAIGEQTSHNPAQIEIYQNEIGALNRHAESINSTIAFMEEELEKRNELLDRGLARTVQVVDLQNQILDLKSERRRTILDATKARLNINEAKYETFSAANERGTDVAAALADVEANIAVLEEQILAQSQLLALRESMHADSPSLTDEFAFHTFSLIRHGPDGAEKSPVTSAERIQPGDIIIVSRTD